MRPTKLIMSGFGPYAEKVTLDMDRLGKGGIYLITGDTGAGKTTIFDAISFALFGEASGDVRKSSSLRSKYADISTPTEVELFFEYRDRTYHIKRNPEYMREKKNGKGTVKENAGAELIDADGQVFTGVRQVTARIEEILGINREQFAQIAMIAQGDFQKLLLESTEERKKIFKKLFNTGKFGRLQDELKRETRELENELNACEMSINQYKKDVKIQENSEDYESIRQVIEDDVPNDRLIECIDTLLKNNERQSQNLFEELNKTEAETASIGETIAKAEEWEKARNAESIALKNINKAEDDCQSAERKLADFKAAAEQDVKVNENILRIKNQIPLYGARDEKQNQLEKLNEKNDSLEGSVAERSQNIDILKKTIAENKEELEKYRESPAKLERFKSEGEAANREKDKINEDSQALEKLIKCRRDAALARETYIEKRNEYDVAKRDYDTKTRAYLDEQAGIIAETLNEGMACPVCGSKSHPNIAKKSKEAPTKEKLESTRKRAEGLAAKMQEAAQDSERKKTLEASAEEAVRKIMELMNMSPETDGNIFKAQEIINNKKEKLDNRIEDLKVAIKNTEDEINKSETLEKEIKTDSQNLEDFVGEKSKLETQLAVIKENIKTLTERILELSQSLIYDSKETAETEMETLEEKVKSNADGLKREQGNLQDARESLKGFKGELRAVRNQLKNATNVDTSQLKESKEKLEAKKAELTEELQNIVGDIKRNQEIKQNILDEIQKSENLEKKIKVVKGLSDTANGDLSGKDKIMLETYVQMTYFDRIVERANLRLLKMSGNRYELKRSVSAENRRSQSGLDLDVRDHYNGSDRSVKTLSGGEKFIASLSLALGLADEIQESAGGIRMDTMFVDEGFGSLDGETLNQAMDALIGLADSNRLVGIISHVEALRDRIDTHIEVTKRRTGGSSVEICIR
ncbi:MAG: SMC family ATPase [Bacillota bacterium]|nr:SMC family ATPase [Bacillota bacterium]